MNCTMNLDVKLLHEVSQCLWDLDAFSLQRLDDVTGALKAARK